MGRDGSVGIATSLGLDGPGIESHYGRNFSLPGVKLPERGANYPPSSSAEVKERVELYLYSRSGPSWPVLGRTLLC